MTKKINGIFIAIVGVLMLFGCSEPPLVVPDGYLASPDWRDEIMYFVMTDRFYNGSTANDVQTTNGVEFGTLEKHWSGGDFAGLIEKLDYIKELGFTCIWITPPVLNQWWDGSIPYGGYHGYWASSFTKVDPHYGTLDEYKNFVKIAHSKGLRVIQDIVCNHAGNYFKMTGEQTGIVLNSNSIPQYPDDPFMSNSIANFIANGVSTDNALNAFHFNPDISDWTDWKQMTNYQASSLDDFNTENPLVLQKMKEWFRFWIREVGIDGYRIDTIKNVPKAWWQDFCYSTDTNNLGIREYAKQFGMTNFYMFGEVHTSSGGDDASAEDAMAGGYTMDDAGKPILDSVIYYPLYGTIKSIFKDKEATTKVKESLDRLPTYYREDSIPKLVTFIDNHDKPRFLNGNSADFVKLALTFIYTSVGVPCVYYGTEQGFIVPRASMFAGGFHGDMTDKDYFNTNSDMYKYVKMLNAMRKVYAPLRRGEQIVRMDESTGAGLLAYTRTSGITNMLVVFNTYETEKYADGISTGYEGTNKFINIFNANESVMSREDGKIYGIIPGKSVRIYVHERDFIWGCINPFN